MDYINPTKDWKVNPDTLSIKGEIVESLEGRVESSVFKIKIPAVFKGYNVALVCSGSYQFVNGEGKIILVSSANNATKNLFWKGRDIKGGNSTWNSFTDTTFVPVYRDSSYQATHFIWNINNESVRLKNLNVKLIVHRFTSFIEDVPNDITTESVFSDSNFFSNHEVVVSTKEHGESTINFTKTGKNSFKAESDLLSLYIDK